MNIDMRPDTSAAIRAELAAIGTKHSVLQRRQRRTRLARAALGAGAIAVATTAAALFVAGAPGSTVTAALGDTTTATHTGPAVVDIGQAPSTAGAVIADITCLSDSGVVQVPTGDGSTASAIHCSQSPTGTMHVIDGQLPAKGSSDFRVDASPETKWRAALQYASTATSKWEVNARGQTYGIENRNGHPDLVPYATDSGEQGWALWDDAYGEEMTGPINIYRTDGVTVIGVATPPAETLPDVPLDQGLIDDLDSVETASPVPPAE
ncbi:hypothetical protein SOM11_08035 [Frigoribacterium sp. CFBP9039]|uniref:hypothetical protein n=1 Tax=unclassified Frigoribacterium TaxID=2627005 RepID=UPI002A6B2A0E|nr:MULTISPECIES: hypothetical protein [unclassified Frigoribacterium]MDY0891490.1 hypothetical protein [Frigoribacterium sp. CFBP9030]MDY0945930.1 hypothetical protein [Frigoribacterium sp. CFBP9039]